MVSLTATADTPASDVSPPPVPVQVSGVTIIVAIVACVGASAAAELEEAAPTSSTVPSVLSFKTAMMRGHTVRRGEPWSRGARVPLRANCRSSRCAELHAKEMKRQSL